MNKQWHQVAQGSALLLMDFQQAILSSYQGQYPKQVDDVAQRAQSLLVAARDCGLLVLHVKVSFRVGYPEVDERNKLFRQVRERNFLSECSSDTDFCEGLAPIGDEVVIVKRRVGAFSGTDLDHVLRAQSVRNLVMAGVTTSGVMLSTVRQAADMDYSMVVARDACFDPDGAVHDVLMNKVFPRQSDVEESASIAAHLSGSP